MLRHGSSPARRLREGSQGFTLVELMVTVVLMAILFTLAIPSFTGMVRNSQVRTVAESLQTGLRLAQAEAVRRNRQTVFTLTNAEPSLTSAAAANGRNWAIHTVPRVSEAATEREFVQGGALSDSAGAVVIDGPAAVCFSSAGRLTPNTSPGVAGATCAVTADPPLQYDFELTGADRRLRVTLSVGGQVRMCDRDRTLSATQPDGCE